MSLQIISTKELREDFNRVLALIEEGESMLLTYRSQPLARISPVKKKPEKKMSTEEAVKLVKKLAGGFHLGVSHTPEELNKMFEESYNE